MVDAGYDSCISTVPPVARDYPAIMQRVGSAGAAWSVFTGTGSVPTGPRGRWRCRYCTGPTWRQRDATAAHAAPVGGAMELSRTPRA
eukprot:scaffold1106_cov608-Prasinococcus_capsulatus_cf.AAC.14